MKFSLRFHLFLVAAMLPAWFSGKIHAEFITTTTTRRLRGKTAVHTRTVYQNDQNTNRKDQLSQENFLDPRPPQTETLRKRASNNQEFQRRRRDDKALHALPAGNLGRDFNATLYNQLHNAPFDIYESAFGVGKEEIEESFPVFIVPDWETETTGVFSAFSRTATPLTFQNMRVLLSWDDIVEASTGAEEDLLSFMSLNNFHSSLFIGKTLGDAASHTPFLGIIVSYHQHSQKNIMIPFAKLEDFFHDTSEKYLLSESTQKLEHDVLHEMLDEERARNSTSTFFHPEIIAETRHNQKREQLEDIEALHFRRLFQLLVRRTFLFSYGYADCLKMEPHNLRTCLDDTFSLVVQMEATVRDALDTQLLQELATVTQLKSSSTYQEACASVDMYGTRECSASSHSSFRGLGTSAFSTLSSVFR
mmetsp:Transcript_16522/g.45522  ORF Transcript_16522/g.45522 Transcript_16522/m.45522 type:complete len:419 (+) Transcript_16522:134-1390(+)|eukprot:CAMPEP_0172364538 /NCGR_PEP_ID=MMETSP1060-20121228/7636_1 /TAXON_ID=37318 /ORGANISM="Pseudo-nitzschia pungens, Strain cf. cingulata" /LENGTH=418 /DNA_ID=CAMNT_0013087561 /DNA_START=110 /DNA_END=1366 /DNA_ORIENTATION=+